MILSFAWAGRWANMSESSSRTAYRIACRELSDIGQGARMSFSMKARLIIIVLFGHHASLAGSRGSATRPTLFRRSVDPSEPRARVCSWRPVASCSIRVAGLPPGRRATDAGRRPSSPFPAGGPRSDDRVLVGMRCTTCHQDAITSRLGVSRTSLWHGAPKSMAWRRSRWGQICEQIKDPRRNGGKTLRAIHGAHANERW